MADETIGPAWDELVDRLTGEIRASGRWRRRRIFAQQGPTELVAAEGGQQLVSFASNDYLGLSREPRVIAAAKRALERDGAGAGAARLVTGTRPVHAELEERLARFHGAERALVFPTGYAANLGVLVALAPAEVTILSNELTHASMIDGARLARGRVAVYRHVDLAAVESMLRQAPPPVLVLSELVFSMDGDVAPVEELRALCRRYCALLVIDEAHAVLGPKVESGRELVRVGTLSKTLGSLGGYVAGATSLVDLVENRARSYIFTTGLNPAAAAAALAAVEIVDSDEGAALRSRLAERVELLAPGFRSPIVPYLVGEEQAALGASEALRAAGLLVPAIRPPTVPPGSSRLRVTLSAAHDLDQVVRLKSVLEDLHLQPGVPPARGAAPARTAPRVIAVCGTGTDVGKTFAAAALITVARDRGVVVAARKPLQSFAEGGGATDAERLAAASGEPIEEVSATRFSYPAPLAPPMAAAALERPAPRQAEVLEWLEHSLGAVDPGGVAVVELVGGVASPHTADGDGLDLLRAIGPDVVLLVAHAGLGTLNDVRLSLRALREVLATVPVRVLLNRYDANDRVHASNLAFLEAAGIEVYAGDEAGFDACCSALLAGLSSSSERPRRGRDSSPSRASE